MLNSLRTVRAARVFNSMGVRLDKSAVFPRTVARSIRSAVTPEFYGINGKYASSLVLCSSPLGVGRVGSELETSRGGPDIATLSGTLVTASPVSSRSDRFMNPQINTTDFNERPFIAIWEVTQACDLACVHCRASAQPDRRSHGTQHE